MIDYIPGDEVSFPFDLASVHNKKYSKFVILDINDQIVALKAIDTEGYSYYSCRITREYFNRTVVVSFKIKEFNKDLRELIND